MKLDLAAVTFFATPAEIGSYSVATSTAYLIRIFGFVLGIVALPLTTKATNPDQLLGAIRQITVLSWVGSVGSMILLIPLLPVMIPTIYGDGFSDAILPAQVLCVGMAAAGVRQALGTCLRGAGFGGASSWAEAGSWFVAIIGFLVLLPTLGIMGAALATSASYFSALILIVIVAKTKGGFSPRSIFVPTASDFEMLKGVVDNHWKRLRGHHLGVQEPK